MRQMHGVGLAVDDARDADDDAVDSRVREVGRGDERIAQPSRCVDDVVRFGVAQLDVLPGAHRPAQVAERAAEEPRPHVQPEHEGGVRDGLEEDRAVARPARVGLGLPDEPGVDERLEGHRDGRLRHSCAAGDLGPGDRRPRPDRLEDGSLVQLLQERRCGACRHLGQES